MSLHVSRNDCRKQVLVSEPSDVMKEASRLLWAVGGGEHIRGI